MAENLKVNARTDILEFKRKHNLLVENTPHKNPSLDYEILENIADSQGHKRFVDFDVTVLNEKEGLEWVYMKASLSGSHLLIVGAGNISANTTFSTFQALTCTLPEWIYKKLKPTVSPYVDYKTVQTTSTGFNNVESLSGVLAKSTNNSVVITLIGKSYTYGGAFRIAFDLLIDNAEPETQGE